jgi:Ankyrin repeats (3 copies)
MEEVGCVDECDVGDALVAALVAGDVALAEHVAHRQPACVAALVVGRNGRAVAGTALRAVARRVGRGGVRDDVLLALGRRVLGAVLGVVGHVGVAPWLRAAAPTALHLAACASDPAFARLLIAYGADVNGVGHDDDLTPLCVAVTNRGSRPCLETLVAAGADMRYCDARGRNPLHLAAEAKNGTAMAVLIRAGADPLQRDRFGHKPIDIDPGLEARSGLEFAEFARLAQAARARRPRARLLLDRDGAFGRGGLSGVHCRRVLVRRPPPPPPPPSRPPSPLPLPPPSPSSWRQACELGERCEPRIAPAWKAAVDEELTLRRDSREARVPRNYSSTFLCVARWRGAAAGDGAVASASTPDLKTLLLENSVSGGSTCGDDDERSSIGGGGGGSSMGDVDATSCVVAEAAVAALVEVEAEGERDGERDGEPGAVELCVRSARARATRARV